MITLAIDSSSQAGSVAVARDGNLLGEFFINNKTTHSQTILPMIDHLLSIVDLTINEIDVIAVTSGPGSFTGLRIGLATVKGLAYSRNIPCVVLSTLEALAFNVQNPEGLIVPVMDARRNQVYTACYQMSGTDFRTIVEPTTLMIAELELFLKEEHSDKRIVLVGDGAELCYNSMKNSLNNLEIAPEHLRHQRASSIICGAYQNNHIDRLVCAQQIEPEYLRIPQAERELGKEKSL